MVLLELQQYKCTNNEEESNPVERFHRLVSGLAVLVVLGLSRRVQPSRNISSRLAVLVVLGIIPVLQSSRNNLWACHKLSSLRGHVFRRPQTQRLVNVMYLYHSISWSLKTSRTTCFKDRKHTVYECIILGGPPLSGKWKWVMTSWHRGHFANWISSLMAMNIGDAQ